MEECALCQGSMEECALCHGLAFGIVTEKFKEALEQTRRPRHTLPGRTNVLQRNWIVRCLTCNDFVCNVCFLGNISHKQICRRCEIERCTALGITVETRDYIPSPILDQIKTMLMIRLRWKRENHPMGCLPADFWKTNVGRYLYLWS